MFVDDDKQIHIVQSQDVSAILSQKFINLTVLILAETSLLMQVILATNIAESSVTIPKVGYVIDSCRSLQVFWDDSRKTDSAGLVWVSKSQV